MKAIPVSIEDGGYRKGLAWDQPTDVRIRDPAAGTGRFYA